MFGRRVKYSMEEITNKKETQVIMENKREMISKKKEKTRIEN